MEAIQFVPLSHLKWKSLMITDKGLVFSNKKYASKEAMEENLEGTSAMEEKEEFWYENIDGVSYLANGEDFTVRKTNFRKKTVSINLNLGDSETVGLIASKLLETGQFSKKEEKANVFSVSKASLIRIGIAAGFTILLFLAARDIAEGGGRNSGGRGGLLKVIVGSILDIIGTAGVLVIGIGIISLFIWQLIKKLQNPPVLMKLEKSKS